MEKIRTYDLADISRVTRLPRGSARVVRKMNLWTTPGYSIQRIGEASELAGQMYAVHKDWVDSKFQPLLPSLQERDVKGALNGGVEPIKKNFEEGLAARINYFSEKGRWFDMQDAVVGYTVGFINILRACERLNISTETSLGFAQQPFGIDARSLVSLFEKNKDLPQYVIERGATHQVPGGLLMEYRDVSKRFERLTKDKRFEHLSESVLVAAADSIYPEEYCLGSLKEKGDRPLRERRQHKVLPVGESIIEGMPMIRQKHKNWCGYATTSMVLQYWGYSELTPEKLFVQINDRYDAILERIDPAPGPGIDTLALAIRELAPELTPRIIGQKEFDIIKEKKGLTEQDLLKMYLKKDIPCIVRTPGHFIVIRGADEKKNTYLVNDPSWGSGWMSAYVLEERWSQQDPDYPRDTRHLMMAMYPQKKRE